MKYFPYILLAFLILTSGTTASPPQPNPLTGFISYVVNGVSKEETKPIEPEKELCDGTGKIWTGDHLSFRKCPGCDACKNKKPQGKEPDKVKPDFTQDLKEVFKPQFKVIAPTRSKELWVLFGKKGECRWCDLQEEELKVLERHGWKIDFDGNFSKDGQFHIRILSLDYFTEIPKQFYVEEKSKDGDVINLYVPTILYWENGMLKHRQIGVLNRWGIGKLFDGKKIESGKDDVLKDKK